METESELRAEIARLRTLIQVALNTLIPLPVTDAGPLAGLVDRLRDGLAEGGGAGGSAWEAVCRERAGCARMVLDNVPNWPESPQVQLLLRRIAEDILARGASAGAGR